MESSIVIPQKIKNRTTIGPSNSTSGYLPKKKNTSSKRYMCTSLVVQWLRIHLPLQGTQVRSLVGEDSTGCRATKPMCHNYRSLSALQSVLHNKKSHCNEELMYRNEEEPPLTTARENQSTATKTQHRPKVN